jgi:hypothetical protein
LKIKGVIKRITSKASRVMPVIFKMFFIVVGYWSFIRFGFCKIKIKTSKRRSKIPMVLAKSMGVLRKGQ